MTPQNIVAFVGTNDGKLVSFNSANYYTSQVQKVFYKPEGGPIGKVLYKDGFLVFCNNKSIYVIHHKRN